jgi:cell division septation protein DedD
VTYLADGNIATARQVRAMFKVDNAADLVYRARNEGISVYTNRVTNSRGEKVFAYRLGNPSAQFEKYLEQGKIDRARKTLYRDAISVAM